jgi:hypothetical protein
VTTVATLRLPIPVAGLVELVDALTLAYGEGLMLRQEGDFVLIEQPGHSEGESDS